MIYAENAHTDGDAIVHFEKADVYHTGDIFITYGIPVIDEDAGGNFYGIIKIIDYLISVSNSETRFIPGHGPVSTVKKLLGTENYLLQLQTR